jgi:hypothetical protein
MAVLAGRQRRVKDSGPRSQADQIVYAEKLGLEPVEERPGGFDTGCANGEFALFGSAAAAAGDHTQIVWEAGDLEETIAQFASPA